ncbi:MAG TPA: tetratricopeptide repeat protein [Bacteroidales bacterium]|nr:tetratricopeptide repeat protein [Bacteroidales bacterium]
MSKKQPDKTEGTIQTVEEAFGKTEQFIEKNQKVILIVIGVLIVVVLGFFGFRKYYLQPREIEAQRQMFMAEKYFEMDSLKLALNGDGNYPGFLDIMSQYNMTKSANLSKYYTGICYLKMGQYQKAIDYLEKFKCKDYVVGPMAKGGIGDAYLELNQPDKAIEYYINAAEMVNNQFTSPLFYMKAAQVYEIGKNYQKALEYYTLIKKNYPQSFESQDIDKSIAFMEGMLKK